MSYRTHAIDTDKMPPGIPWIIGNEAAERFSFYGMRTILFVFMTKYLWLMDSTAGTPVSEAAATEHYHDFVKYVYFTPLIGALVSDVFLGKYRTIIWLSLVYCAGHAALACMGAFGYSGWWLFAGLLLICIGSGGIKPCVSAHVGDQFGPRNQHLLTRIYNWFYFSINLGSFFSTLLTPWLLEWYGPHWAFGVPGVLMAIATLLFWMGRRQFAHIPPAGMRFFTDLFSREGLVALAKLIPLFVFVAMFWALYDQTGSSWVFQAGQMNLDFLGIRWLESQVQAVNPILILVYIPIFTFLVYPLLGRWFKLTPLRKIGIGFFLSAAAFAVCTFAQSRIDAGQTPSVGWQLLAYLVITAAEVMVSIVGLEFAYTQAPKSLKSMIMSLYLLSVFLGNHFTAAINDFIQIPSAADRQRAEAIAKLPPDWQKDPRTVVLGGRDGVTGTDDDYVQRLVNGTPKEIEIPGAEIYAKASALVEKRAMEAGGRLPAEPDINAAGLGKDPWGQPLQYEILNASQARIWSAGPDGQPGTEWDQGLTIEVNRPTPKAATSPLDFLRPAEPWLDKRKRELGIATTEEKAAAGLSFSRTAWVGGQTKLHGSAYFRFFTWLMFGTAVLWVPFAMIYRPKTYLQD